MKCKNVVVRKTFISRFKLSCIQDPLVKRLDPHFTWIRSFLEYCPSKAGSTISTTFSLFVSLGRAWKKNKNITVFFSDWDVKMKYHCTGLVVLAVSLMQEATLQQYKKQCAITSIAIMIYTLLTQETRTCSPGGRLVSIGTRPVRSSSRTTP